MLALEGWTHRKVIARGNVRVYIVISLHVFRVSLTNFLEKALDNVVENHVFHSPRVKCVVLYGCI